MIKIHDKFRKLNEHFFEALGGHFRELPRFIAEVVLYCYFSYKPLLPQSILQNGKQVISARKIWNMRKLCKPKMPSVMIQKLLEDCTICLQSTVLQSVWSNFKIQMKWRMWRLREQRFPNWTENTEAAALVVIDLSTAIGASVGSTVEECVREGSSSIVPPPFWNHIIRNFLGIWTQTHFLNWILCK